MTEEELQAIEDRASAATPGPWEYDGMHNEIQCPQSADSYWLIVSESRSAPDQAQKQTNSFFDANYAFIAAARSDVPALVAEVRRLRVELDELQGAWAKYPDFDLERLEDGRYEASAFEGKDPLGNRNAWAIGATPLEAVRALAVQWERGE